MGQVIKLEVVGELEHRDIALRTVSAACRLAYARQAHIPEARETLAYVMSAVGEAFNNIAVHGYRGGPAGMVEICIAVGPSRLAVELRDYGLSFDPRSVPMPDELPESGMGVFIISSMMDEVEYRPGHPNVLRLVKRLGVAGGSSHLGSGLEAKGERTEGEGDDLRNDSSK